MLTKITTLTLSCLAAIGFSAACAAEGSYNVNQINIPEKPEFMASLGIAKDAKPDLTKDQKTQLAGKAYHEKADQHFMSVHAQKGVSCNTCHDPRSLDGVAWMAVVNKPVIRQTCQDCHTVQADMQSHTRSHKDVDCIGCHMPNIPVVSKFEEALKGTDRFAAVRRAHLYKINTDAQASMVTKDPEKGWVYSRDKEDHGFVDLQWSCGRPAPADWTVCEGRGCHSPATSELDKGLIYKSQQEIAYEVQKVQRPVKESWDRVVKGVDRITKLLEITKMTPADQTEARLLLDKAAEIADLIKKDGSWGAHASHYTKDRLAAAESYLAKAQVLIDNGGYRHATK